MADVSIERRLIGLMLLDQTNISHVIRAGIRSTDYEHAPHSLLHNAILDTVIDTKGHVDVVLLAEQLQINGRLEGVGGVPAIEATINSVEHSDRVADLVLQF